MLNFLFSLVVIFTVPSWADQKESCFKIDTGEEFCDLVFRGNAQQLWIAGSGDLAHVKKIVSPYGVKPILNKEGRALVSFSFVQYASTTVGPYNEFVIMYAVQRNDKNLGPYSPLQYSLKNSLIQKDQHNPEYGFYMQKLVLGGENEKSVHAAIEIGKKGYGFPKISGEVKYRFDPSEKFQFSVKSHDGSIRVVGQMQNSYFGSLNMLSVPTMIHSLTSGLGHAQWSRATGFAWGGVPQSVKNLQLTVDGGDEIKDLQFQPGMVLYTGRYRFELQNVK